MVARKRQALSPEERLEAALVPEDDWPYEVPDNWCWVRLGTCVSKSMEKTADFSDGPLYVGLEHMESGHGVVSYGDASSLQSTKGVIHPGQVLYGRLRPYLNKHDVAKVDGICSTDILVYNVNGASMPEFINLYMDTKAFIDNASYNSKGVNLPRVSPAVIEATALPLPPIREQRRIVPRIEWLLSKLDDAEADLREVIEQSEQRQAAILHKGFSGDLTRKWRLGHVGQENSALSKIAAFAGSWKTKDQRLLAAQQADYELIVKDGHAWVYCTIGAIGRVTNGSTPSRKVDDYWDGNIPWVSSGEVRNNIIADTREGITQKGYDSSSVQLLPKGTVLIAMIGEGKTRGQSSILDLPATINQNIAAVVIDHGYVDSRYLWYWFRYNYKRNREAGAGSGPQALNCQRVRELPFVLPEIDEQREIARIIGALMEREEQMCNVAIDAIEAINSLKKTLLSKALRGELCTNDPSEPSSKELLSELLAAK